MAIKRMDHVGVVVDDLEAALAFFVELGMDDRRPELTAATHRSARGDRGVAIVDLLLT